MTWTLVVCSACSTMRKPVAGKPQGELVRVVRQLRLERFWPSVRMTFNKPEARPHRVGDAVVPIDVMPVVDPFPAEICGALWIHPGIVPFRLGGQTIGSTLLLAEPPQKAAAFCQLTSSGDPGKPAAA